MTSFSDSGDTRSWSPGTPWPSTITPSVCGRENDPKPPASTIRWLSRCSKNQSPWMKLWRKRTYNWAFSILTSMSTPSHFRSTRAPWYWTPIFPTLIIGWANTMSTPGRRIRRSRSSKHFRSSRRITKPRSIRNAPKSGNSYIHPPRARRSLDSRIAVTTGWMDKKRCELQQRYAKEQKDSLVAL